MAMWLEEPVRVRHRPARLGAYGPGERLTLTVGVVVRRQRAVGMLGRFLVWSQVCPKRFHVEHLKADIRERLRNRDQRRRPRLP